ncbi:MAG: thioredoxin domain-containing protein [Fimbriimonas sp.]|nr:thioredoxin domain-containing protein [Fimbriimonas sp.]
MPHPLIYKGLPITLCAVATAMFGVSLAQTDLGMKSASFDSVKPAEWTGKLRPSIGSASAAIKVVCFVDYECPICRITDPLVRKAVAKRHDVALIYREFPLFVHQFAKSAAIVAENAREHGTFDVSHRRLMEGKSLTEASVKDAARKAGVSMIATPQTAAKLAADHDLEQKAKLSFVPTFVVIESGKITLLNRSQLLDFLK